MIFHATIQQGRTVWEDPKKVAQFIDKVEGCRIVIDIEKWSPRCSARQHRFYRGVILMALEEANIGYTREEWHAIAF